MGIPDQLQSQRFGDVALHQKFITREQLDAALVRQRELGVPIGEVLVAMGFVTPSQVAAILKFQRVLYGLTDRAARGETKSSPDPLLGETLGGCLILELLGSGAMGRAYKAHHIKLDRDVCVKVLNADLARDRRTMQRFTREARSAARLEHPGIVSVHDFDEVGPYAYIVMQHVDGKSLKEVLEARGPIGPKRATFVGARLAEALAHAHAQGIVHRDLKPANVLVSKQGQIKLTDFGLVRVIDRPDGTSSFGELIGTPAYMSPEQAQAVPDVDGRSDVYGLGILVWELSCGRVPFEGHDLVSLLKKHIDEPLPSLRARCPGCPEALDALLARFCAKAPRDRPDAATAARELRNLYRSDFGAEPPSDVTGPPTLARLAPIPAPKTGSYPAPGLAELPTAFYDQRDILEVAVDKLVARALAGQLAQATADLRHLAPPVAREATVRVLEAFVAAGRGAELVASAAALVEAAADHPPALALLGRAHLAARRPGDAERYLEAAHARRPDEVDWAIELAQVRASLGRRPEARKALDGLLARRGRDPVAFRRAAEVAWIVLQDAERAAAWYGAAADLDRNAFEPRQQQGFLLLELDRPADAARALEDAVARQPGSALAHELLGKARLEKGDRPGGVAALRRAIELDAHAAEARSLLIEEARREGRWPEMASLATEGLEKMPGDRDLELALALAREQLGDDEAAARMFANLLARDPGNVAAREGLERLRPR